MYYTTNSSRKPLTSSLIHAIYKLYTFTTITEKKMEGQNVLLCDADGFFIDSTPLADRINEELHPELSQEDHAKRLEQNIFRATDEEHFHSQEKSETVERFFEKFCAGWPSITLIPGMKAELLYYASIGIQLEIVTSNSEDLVRSKINETGIAHCFGGIYGFQTSKCKTTKIKFLQEKYPNAMMLFGTDTIGDKIEADAANIPSVCTTWGFKGHDRKRFARAQPYAIVDHVYELRQTVLEYFHL